MGHPVGFRLTGSKKNWGLTSFWQFVRPATALTAPFENRTVAVATNTLKRCLLFAAFVGAPIAIYAQSVDTMVEVPTNAHKSAIIEIPNARQNVADNSDDNVPMAGEYKSTKNVVEQEKETCWNWAVDFSYASEYNFRGTDLTPGTGALFMNAEVSKWNFTAGITEIRQVGTARADSWSMGEGGGGGGQSRGGGAFAGLFNMFPETTQRMFNEIDVFLNYHISLRWVDLAVGNVGFFIHREAVTKVESTFLGLPFLNFPAPTVGDEQFDRLFARLSTSKIPYVVPSITYYQTIYNDGSDGHALLGLHKKLFELTGVKFPFFIGPLHRNTELGGYFEGQLRGDFRVSDWLTINPYGKISYSLDDRVEPIDNPQTFHELIRGHSLSDWNVVQAGLELPIHLLHFVGTSSVPCAPPDVNVYLVPFGWYSHHISEPTPGTDRDEEWGGVKLTVTF